MNCAINGQAFMIDLTQPFYRAYRRQLAPLVRSQADTSNEPGEQSMDPNGLWRRSFEDWRNGAGQRYLDRSSSLDNNYYLSKGVETLANPWQMTLLPDTINADTSTAGSSPMWLLQAGGYVYWVTSTNVYYATAASFVAGSPPTWTAVSGLPVVSIDGACSDGYTIYIAMGSNGIYTIEPGGTSVTNYLTASVAGTTALGYANGRLMLGIGPTLYNITAGGSSLPVDLQVLPNTNWNWVGFAEGDQVIYAAASSGGSRDSVYGIALQTDGATLIPGPLAVVMPTGEQITCVYGYLGFLVIGSSLGIRILPGNAAPLSPLIPTPFHSVQCAAGWGGFIWFGWTDYDGTSTGLGKLSLENFVNESLSLPAYASDRMATAQGNVLAVTVANGIPVFGVNGVGLFMDSANLVQSGSMQSGYIGYDLTDLKIAALIDLQTAGPLVHGSYEAVVYYDGAPNAAVMVPQGSPAINTLQLDVEPGASKFEVVIRLYADPIATTQGPTFTRFTLRAYPAPLRPITWQLPLILNEEGVSLSSSSAGYSPLAALVALETLAQAGSPVTYQEADQTYTVFVTDVQFLPDQTTERQYYYNGLALVNLQSLPAIN